MTNRIDPSPKIHEYTSFATPIDLVAAGNGEPAHYIRIVAGSGTITVKDGTSTTETLTVAAGEEITARFREITSVVGVTNIRVQWPRKPGQELLT